ncbi:MAG: helix-turn-helix domain-containing protein [Halobacteriota archaeon]
MSNSESKTSVDRLVELLDEQLRRSEFEILTALAEANEPLTETALAEATGYTERTIHKRVGTLEERIHSETLLSRDEEGNPVLHPQFARSVREYLNE